MVEIVQFTTLAVENFFENTLETRSEALSCDALENIYTTMIDISSEGAGYSFFICMDEALLKRLAMHLLYEENPDQEMLIDLLNESANLIVGNAKVLWEEAHTSQKLRLTTPQYQGFFEKNFSKRFDEKLFFKADNNTIMIGVENVKVREEA